MKRRWFLSLGMTLMVMLLCFAGSLFVSRGVAAASSTRPLLEVTPTSLNGKADCTYTHPSGWVCSTLISRGDTLTTDLTWSVYSNDIPGITFTPASGVLAAGASATVTVTIPDTVCPAHATLIFQGPANSDDVSWNCDAPVLTLDQTALSAGTTCPAGVGGWNCTVKVGEAAGEQGQLNWFARSSLGGVTFTPASGTISPGASTPVSIFVPASACDEATFTFWEPRGTTLHLPWTCTSGPPPSAALTVTPTTLIPTNPACSLNGAAFQCSLTLSETATSQAAVNWNATTNLGNATIAPSQGTLTPGGSISVTVQSLSCQNGSVTFSAANAVPVTIPWNCEPSTLTLDITSLNQFSPVCIQESTPLAGTTYSCHVTLSLAADAQGSLNWSATVTGGSIGVVVPIFSPASGTIAPGQSVGVVISRLMCGGATLLTFAGPNGMGAVTIAFQC